MPNLSDYITDTQALLRDSSNLFTPLSQLKRNINKARIQCAKFTGCISILVTGQSSFGNMAQAGSAIPGAMVPGALPGNYPAPDPDTPQIATANSFQTISGVEKYPFKYANPYVQAANAGVDKIIDVVNLSVSWGGIRPAMNFVPFEDLQAYYRSYNVGMFSYPFCWSTDGDGVNANVWLFPAPSVGPSTQVPGGQGEMEWLTTCIPKVLNNDNDPEALPENFTDAVPFFAAFLCLIGAQRFGAAQIHLNHFTDFLGIDRVSSDRGKISSFYPDY